MATITNNTNQDIDVHSFDSGHYRTFVSNNITAQINIIPANTTIDLNSLGLDVSTINSAIQELSVMVENAPNGDLVLVPDDNPVDVFYTDRYFYGRIYVRKSRWYGLSEWYGDSVYMSSVYGSRAYDSAPDRGYRDSTGFVAPFNMKLKKVKINIPYSSSLIDNLQIYINKQQKNYGVDNSVSNTQLYWENTKAQGHRIESDKPYLIEIESDKPYLIEIDLDQDVDENEFISIYFNSSSNSGGTKYLYNTKIDLVYQKRT